MKLHDLLWLAGLLEGEGCFSYQCSPAITLGMTDRDIVARVASLTGKTVRGPYKYKHNRRPVFYTSLFGDPAAALMRRLLPFMGVRRSEKITSILARRSVAPGKAHRAGKGAIPTCHPSRKNYANRLCTSCYRKKRWSEGLSR